MKRVAIMFLASAVLIAVAVAIVLSSPAKQRVTDQAPRPLDTPNNGVLPVSFEEAVNLTNNTRDSVYGQVAAAGEAVFVVWQDSIPSDGSQGSYASRNYDIFVVKSSDGGESFGPPLNLSDNPGFSEHPQVSAHRDSVYVVWADDSSGIKQVMFSRSGDQGVNFKEGTSLSNNMADSFNQEIAVHENSVYVVWLEEGLEASRVVLRASDDGGETFADPLVISDKANSATLPKIAADGQGVHVTWSLIDQQASGLFYSMSKDGDHFEQEKELSDISEFGEPQIVVRNSTVLIISGGMDKAQVRGLLLAKSFDGGASFSSEIIDLNGSFANPLNVEAAIANDEPSILYVAGQVLVSGDEEILLMPVNVQQVQTATLGLANLSKNERISECPSISISQDRVFVVWEDLTPGNHEILYAKGEMI